jgi:hypothetical protein
MTPSNTVQIPSISPSVAALAPRAVTKKTGSTLWIISDDVSMPSLTKPSARTSFGTCARGSIEFEGAGILA